MFLYKPKIQKIGRDIIIDRNRVKDPLSLKDIRLPSLK